MKRIISKANKLLICCAVAAMAAVATIAAFFGGTDKAYAYSSLPTGSNAIGNIYKDNGKFDLDNLNALAAKAGNYTDINALITDVENNDKTIKSSAFGETIVYFGKDAVNNSELAWIPAYVSEDINGNAILTLWLARTDSDNSEGKEQEVYCFNDEYNWHEDTNPSSNNYSTSKIRSVALNNGGTYYTGYGNTDSQTTPSPTSWTATSNKTNKFEMYTTGELASYIVAPSQVGWQKNANFNKNDPNWAGNSNGHYTQDGWLNDKLWLPSLYEVYDNSKSANSTATMFTNDGGLWETSISELSNSTRSWLRSSNATYYDLAYNLSSDGTYSNDLVLNVRAVRPALHINLKSAAQAACTHTNLTKTEEAPSTCVTQGTAAYWTCNDCNKMFSNAGATTEITSPQSIPIDSTAHSFDTTWHHDGTGHWHECTRASCGAKDTVVGHTAGASATCTTAQTCTVCGEILTAQLGHSWATNWSSDASGHWHECTRAGCSEKNEEAAHNPDRASADCTNAQTCTVCNFEMAALLGHDFATAWSHDATNHWHVCQRAGCDATDTPVAHTFNWVVDTPATVTSTGLKHEECICGEKRNENTEIPVETCPHTNKTHHDAVAPTCTDSGSKEYWHCEDCGKDLDVSDLEITDTTLPIGPDNHDFGDWTVTKEPTFTEDGEKERECSRCHTKETDTVPKKSTSSEADISWWVWLIVGLAGVAVVGVVVIIIVVVKKKNAATVVQDEIYDDTEL